MIKIKNTDNIIQKNNYTNLYLQIIDKQSKRIKTQLSAINPTIKETNETPND